METTIYHIVHPAWWEKFANQDFYESETLLEEKFIHLSTLAQVNGTLLNYFQGSKRLFLIHINPEKLSSTLLYEDLFATGIDFPHLYGPLNKEAVVQVQELLADADGFLKV
jgi:hypothetical protein